ncbi:MAG: AAA family ATPase [Chloroflexota bacterium]|nr:AAA family ATPase [Chloroflexota bacterium]
MIPALHMYLLGDFLLISGDTPVTTVNVSRVQSLLAYLVLHRSTPQDRSHLAFLLWPASTESQAHSNLRKVLHQLRQILPQSEHFLHADRHSLQWLPAHPHASWTLDVLELEQALAQAEQIHDTTARRQALEQVIHLYRGDLLPGCYEEWILSERDRLRQLFFQAAERLMALLEQERDYEAAIKAAQHLLRHDPLHEATYRHLMGFYAQHGDRAAALRVYHTCATVLERELAINPSEATRQVYESLMHLDTSSQDRAGPFSLRSIGAPLVGRKSEWGHLQTAWHRAASGHPHMAILSGDAGIGKTRLAEEMEAWVSRQGLTTASARCYAAEGRLAYAPVAAWFRADTLQAALATLDDVWLTELVRLVPTLLVRRPDLPHPTPMMEGWQRQHFFEALARALLNTRQPLLLLLDDLQWCDNETLEWLHYLLRFEPHVHLLLIGTVRAEEAPSGHPLVSLLGTLQRTDLLTEIALGPLNTTETISLAQQVAGHQLALTLTSDLYHETEGNPLFVVEMLRAGTLQARIGEQQDVKGPQSLLTASTSALPPTVQTVLAARLAQLSPLAHELASLAAVIGREFSFAVLARASGKSEEVLVQGVDELWRRRIVREQGQDAYDFSHGKLRAEAYAALSSARKRFLHRRVAEALEEVYAGNLDTVSGQVATHYERAGLSEQAILSYQRAGEVALRVYANAEAIVAFQRAAALLETAATARNQHEQPWKLAASLYERLGDVLGVVGKHLEARQSYQRSLTSVSAQAGIRQARLHRKIAATWRHPPNPERALESYRAAEHILEQAPMRSEPAWQDEWLQTQLEQLQPLFMLARMPEMTRVIKQARPAIEQHGTAAQRALLFRHMALRDIARADYVVSEETLARCRMALEASQESGQLHLLGSARFAFGYCLLLAGKLDQAEEQLQAIVSLGELIGDAELHERSLAFLTLVFRQRGQVEEVRSAIKRETRYTGVITANRAWVAWRDGNIEEAEAYGRAALEEWQRQHYTYVFQWTGLWPLIDVALSQERLPEAMDYVRMLLAPRQQRPVETLLTMLEAVVQAWDAGQRERASVLLQRALPLAREMNYL